MTNTEIAQKLIDVYDAKNKDYGNSAHQTFCEFGEVALVIRISDKLSRFQTLLSGKERNVTDESILDTLGDAVTYLAMLIGDITTYEADKPIEENLNNSDNITATKLALAIIGRDATSDENVPVDAEHADYYRNMLLGIWREVSYDDIRIKEYEHLAKLLIEEYRCRA